VDVRSFVLFVLVVISGMPPAIANDWRQFRGPDGNGIVSGAKLPAQWDENTNVAWKRKVPGRGWSQPVVSGDKLFITAALSENEEKPRRFERGIIPDARDARTDWYQWKVYCLSANSGEMLWEAMAFEGKPSMPKHRSNTYASETPVTDGERVICYFGVKGLVCYDMSGKPQWQVNLGEYKTQAGWGTGSSPVILDDAVLVQCDNEQSSFLVALDKRTGAELWRIDREEKSNWSTPYVWKNKLRTELVIAGGTKIRSYDPASREVLWEMAGSGRTSISPVGDDEHIYLDSVQRFQGSPGRLAAIRAGAAGDISLPDKDDAMSNEFVSWSVMLKSYRNASPVLYDGGVYMLDQNSGIVRCFDAKSGELLFQQRLPNSAGFTASPWVNDGKIFLLDETGLTVAIGPGPKLKLLESNKLDDELFWSSIAVCGDRLLIRSVNHLYCIQKSKP
jgi:outer membrane protein assembly factor BamB